MKMDLQERLGYETLSGILAAGIVSPFITIIDKSITANASGRQKLLDGIWSEIKLLMTHPIKFVKRKEFLLIWCVYSGTYITANTIEAVCDNYDVSHYYPKFIGTSAVNITLGILKDKSFTKMFGVGPAKHFPKISYLCFAARELCDDFRFIQLNTLSVQAFCFVTGKNADGYPVCGSSDSFTTILSWFGFLQPSEKEVYSACVFYAEGIFAHHSCSCGSYSSCLWNWWHSKQLYT